MFFISYAKTFFIPPSDFGIGSPRPLRSFENALAASSGGRNIVAFVNNGHTGGDIEQVINRVADQARSTGKDVHTVNSDYDLLTLCRSSLRGVSHCYGAASFYGSPSEGSGLWNYTLRADGTFGTTVFVNQDDNDAEIYILPFQHAIDSAIASLNGTELTQNISQFPYTSENAEERRRTIQEKFMDSLINILAVAFYIGVCGVTYQLTGHMASEREIGMSQLIEAMTPNRIAWRTPAARLLSNHLAFDIIYLPGWIIMGVIVARIVFPNSSVAMLLFYHILAGLSLTSFSILGASLFRKAQLSGITVTLTTVILAIIAQVTKTRSSGAVAILSLLFPPMNYVYFLIYCAHFERVNIATDLVKGAPNTSWQIPGIVFWVFLIVQTLLFPVMGYFVEKTLYGTASASRRFLEGENIPKAIELREFSKHYPPNWWQQRIRSRFSKVRPETVIAVQNLTLSAAPGEILVLLGANGR
jgi:ATP-binding cassette, subfamily A (ABC1), member 3